MIIDLEAGMTLARYRLLRLIARGGMGSVWAAKDEGLDREVALKVLPPLQTSDPWAPRRFEREARAMARLHHANVVSVFDVGTADPGSGDELPFLVMELIIGQSLDHMVAEGPLPPEQVLHIFSQVARALSAAHAAGIIHRDLKPSNVMVTEADHVTVLDFGLARLQQQDGRTPEETLTTPGMVLGSCPYMAPEQALGQEVGPHSDIFSCGAVLYEALCGERVFDGPTPMRVLQSVVQCEYTPLAELAPDLSPSLVHVVERCLQKDPTRRYANCQELARDFRTINEGEGPTLRIGSASIKAVAIQRRRVIVKRLLAGAATLLIGILAGVLWGRAGFEQRKPDPGGWKASVITVSAPCLLRHPEWNPGGSKLAVVCDPDGADGVQKLLLVPATGGTPNTLLKAQADQRLSWPRFSPKGNRILVTVGVGGLRILSPKKSEDTIDIDRASRGAWLDEDNIVFSHPGTNGAELWKYQVSTGERTPLLEAEGGQEWLASLPRPGGGLAALSGRVNTVLGIFVTSSEQGTRREWLKPGPGMSGLAWAPGGRSLVAVVDNKLVRLTASGAVPILPFPRTVCDPAFSPDGQHLAVVLGTGTAASRDSCSGGIMVFSGLDPERW